MKNWWVVANAARARILEREGDDFVHVSDLVHPQSRQKGSELEFDRPGHVPGKQAHGTGSSALDPRHDPREREREHFAREVAAALNDGVAAGRCAGIVLVASNPFLGELKQHLGEQAHKALLRTMAADYTTLDDRELAQRLGRRLKALPGRAQPAFGRPTVCASSNCSSVPSAIARPSQARTTVATPADAQNR